MGLMACLSVCFVWLAPFILRRSGNVDKVYDKIGAFGFLWEKALGLLSTLGIDEIMVVPSKHRPAYIPLFLSASEKSVANIFKPLLGETVLDIGAYVGRYTMMASKYVGPNGKVVSVEAHPENFQLLKQNCRECKNQNVIPVNIAISNNEGRIKLFEGYNSGWHSIIEKEGDKGWSFTKYTEVPCKTVDCLLKELGIDKIDWMKVDVEGAELMVLQGSQETLKNSKNLKIILEIHPWYTDENAIFELLNRMHYTMRYLETPNASGRYHILAWQEHRKKQMNEV